MYKGHGFHTFHLPPLNERQASRSDVTLTSGIMERPTALTPLTVNLG